MPVKPSPSKQVCTNCHWKKILAPDSDVLMLPEDIPEHHCPKCGAEVRYAALGLGGQLALMKLLRKKRKRFKF